MLSAIGCGCGPITIGPFRPANPRPCMKDLDCSDDEMCWYPSVEDTYPVCMPDHGSRSWPDSP